MAFSKDRLIVAQNSATATSTIVAALVNTGGIDTAEVVDVFSTIRTAIFEGSIALADGAIEGQSESEVRTASRPTTGGNFQGGGQGSDAGAGIALKFGKYAGQTIAAVYGTDPKYIEWLSETSNNEFIKGKAGEYLASVS